jgi:nucleotide-binding universal stress UspA family protein
LGLEAEELQGMKILLTCDPCGSYQEQLQEVIGRAWPPDTRFFILAVAEPGPAMVACPESQVIRQAAGVADRFASCLRSNGFDATAQVRPGIASFEIVNEAIELEADLIVLGAPRNCSSLPVPGGAVARHVLRLAPCSVEIARALNSSHDEKPRGVRVLVPSDGSEDSQAAAHSIADRPWPPNSVFEVVGIAEPVSRLAATLHAQDAIKETEETLCQAGLRVIDTVMVPAACPKEVIIEEADRWQADLIVLGSGGTTGFSLCLPGSISEAVAMRAGCSVEIYR